MRVSAVHLFFRSLTELQALVQPLPVIFDSLELLSCDRSFNNLISKMVASH